MKLYVINNYGREAHGQDVTIGYASSKEEADDIARIDWEHLTDIEKKAIGSEYVINVYEVPDTLLYRGLNLVTIAREMLDLGLMDTDDNMCSQYIINA